MALGGVKMEPCHPTKSQFDCTCYSKEQLLSIARQLRKEGHLIDLSATRNDLWKQISEYMKSKHDCKFDWCWLSTPEVKRIIDKDLHHMTFRPRAPNNWSLHVSKPGDRGKFRLVI